VSKKSDMEEKRFGSLDRFHKRAITDYQQAWATIKCEPTAWDMHRGLLMIYETAPDMVKTIDKALGRLFKLEQILGVRSGKDTTRFVMFLDNAIKNKILSIEEVEEMKKMVDEMFD